MKEIQLFYLKSCPHCTQAIKILDAYLKEDCYKNLKIVRIEESERPDYANQFDYYYVPTFYVGEEKICEGSLTEQQIEEVLKKAL